MKDRAPAPFRPFAISPFRPFANLTPFRLSALPPYIRTNVRMTNAPFDDRLDHLLSAAARVFARKGYHSTTMRDLARESEMSLAGMYYYVEGKDELLYKIQKRCFEAVIAGAGTAVSSETDPTSRLSGFIRHHVLFFTRNMPEMKVLSHEAESLGKDRLGDINTLKKQYVEMLVGLINSLGRPSAAVDSRVASYALFGMMNWIYTWYRSTGAVTPEALADQITQLFLNGIMEHETAFRTGG